MFNRTYNALPNVIMSGLIRKSCFSLGEQGLHKLEVMRRAQQKVLQRLDFRPDQGPLIQLK